MISHDQGLWVEPVKTLGVADAAQENLRGSVRSDSEKLSCETRWILRKLGGARISSAQVELSIRPESQPSSVVESPCRDIVQDDSIERGYAGGVEAIALQAVHVGAIFIGCVIDIKEPI